jgi:hypothetical protein
VEQKWEHHHVQHSVQLSREAIAVHRTTSRKAELAAAALAKVAPAGLTLVAGLCAVSVVAPHVLLLEADRSFLRLFASPERPAPAPAPAAEQLAL